MRIGILLICLWLVAGCAAQSHTLDSKQGDQGVNGERNITVGGGNSISGGTMVAMASLTVVGLIVWQGIHFGAKKAIARHTHKRVSLQE